MTSNIVQRLVTPGIVSPSHVESDGDVLECLLPCYGLHKFPVNCPELIKLITSQTKPKLIVILLLHHGHHLPIVLQLVSLLQAGHKYRLHLFSGMTRQQLFCWKLREMYCKRPWQVAIMITLSCQQVIQQTDRMVP